MIKSVLITTDLSGYSSYFLRNSISIAKSLDTKITLFHVYEAFEDGPMYEYFKKIPSKFLSVKQKYVDAVMENMDQQVAVIEGEGFEYEKVIRDGKPWMRTLEYEKNNSFQLIIQGNHANYKSDGLFLGKTALNVIRKAATPVLTLKRRRKEEITGFKHIFVPTDFSEASFYSMEYAFYLAKLFRASVSIVHVYEQNIVPLFAEKVGKEFKKIVDSCMDSGLQTAEEKMRDIKKKYSDKEYKINTRIIENDTRDKNKVDAIMEYIDGNEVDLVVISTHGQAASNHVLMGGNAEVITRAVSCPVLTVKPKDFKFVEP